MTGEPAETEEYKAALAQANSFSDTLALSKAAIYDMLVIGYGDEFSKGAIEYAMNNLKADFKLNALKTALSYISLGMDKNKLYDQLCAPSGERFTEDEAFFAMTMLNKKAK